MVVTGWKNFENKVSTATNRVVVQMIKTAEPGNMKFFGKCSAVKSKEVFGKRERSVNRDINRGQFRSLKWIRKHRSVRDGRL